MDLSIPVHPIHNKMPATYSLVSTKGTEIGFNPVSIYAEVTSIHLNLTQLGILNMLPCSNQYYSLCKLEGKEIFLFIDFNRGKFRPKSQRQENDTLNDWVAQAE